MNIEGLLLGLIPVEQFLAIVPGKDRGCYLKQQRESASSSWYCNRQSGRTVQRREVRRRFLGQDKVWPLEKIIAWCIDVTVTDWVPCLICPANETISVSLRLETVERLNQIELISLIKSKGQKSSLTICEGKPFFVKQRHSKWIHLWNTLNRASKIQTKQCEMSSLPWIDFTLH